MRVVIVWAAVAAAAVTDWQLRGVWSFWDAHSMAGGIVSGVLLLFAGLFGVEALFEHREQQRWRLAARVAFKELGFNADEVRRGLRMLLTGAYESRFDVPFDVETRAGLAARLRAHPELAGLDDGVRLRLLLADVEWVRIAQPAVDQLKHRHRRALALWTPVLITSERLGNVADRVARLNELLFELQEPLRLIEQGRAEPDTSRVAELAWRRAVEKAVELQESLMREAELHGWTHHGARDALPQSELGSPPLAAPAAGL